MDAQSYNELIKNEETHWWFVSRRAISKYLLDKIKFPKDAKILEIGCGSGGNLPMLSGYGQVFACEMNDNVREHSIKRGIGTITYGKLPDELPFIDKKFDLVAMFDVLEHVEDDVAALKAVADKLNAGGKLLITVPAFQFLFSRHDRLHHHFRRYGKKELEDKIKTAGFEIDIINYWNFFLFPVAVMSRIIDSLKGGNGETIGSKTPAPFINNILKFVVSFERFLVTTIPLLFGVSLILVARKV